MRSDGIREGRLEPVSTVVLDLDNTLWDWVHIWHSTFSAELDVLLRLSGINREVLLSEIREVHQRHGTSEYAFLIEELPGLQALHPGEDLTVIYGEAIQAYRNKRREVLKLYPLVEETLSTLKGRGCLIVAYTESLAYYTGYRVRKLGLDGVLDYLYSPADHDLPSGLTPDVIRKYPAMTYEMNHTVHRSTPPGELKPNPDVLKAILSDVRGDPTAAVYVGDSLMKDVAMAQEAGVRDVYAKYGHNRDGPAYELLRAVTHWPDKDVQDEKDVLTAPQITPTHVLEESIGELIDLFEYVPHE